MGSDKNQTQCSRTATARTKPVPREATLPGNKKTVPVIVAGADYLPIFEPLFENRGNTLLMQE
jgi:hypothetical protein